MRQICDTYLEGRHDLQVLDLYQNPEAAGREQIVAVPTLIRVLPAPLRRIIGDLSDQQRVLASLDIELPVRWGSDHDDQPVVRRGRSKAIRNR